MSEQQNNDINAWLAPLYQSSEAWLSLQANFVKDFQQIFSQALTGNLPEIKDRRFSSEAWKKNPQLLSLAHLYLLSSKAIFDVLDKIELDQETKDKLDFAVHQWVDAVAPSNFFCS
nr:hypothetical protein [Pelistega indica]